MTKVMRDQQRNAAGRARNTQTLHARDALVARAAYERKCTVKRYQNGVGEPTNLSPATCFLHGTHRLESDDIETAEDETPEGTKKRDKSCGPGDWLVRSWHLKDGQDGATKQHEPQR